jgi:hypothetical protein
MLFCDLALPPQAIVAVGLAVAPADGKVDHCADPADFDAHALPVGKVALPRIWIAPQALVAFNSGEAAAGFPHLRCVAGRRGSESKEKAGGKNEMSSHHQTLRFANSVSWKIGIRDKIVLFDSTTFRGFRPVPFGLKCRARPPLDGAGAIKF